MFVFMLQYVDNLDERAFKYALVRQALLVFLSFAQWCDPYEYTLLDLLWDGVIVINDRHFTLLKLYYCIFFILIAENLENLLK